MFFKKCGNCEKKMDIKKFGKDKHQKDGLHNFCKNCVNKKHKERYHNNPEKVKLYQKEYFKKYYEKNKEKVLEQRKRYCILHPEKVKEWQKKHRKQNPNYVKEYYKKNKEKIKMYWGSIQGRDVRSNHWYKVSISNMLEWQNYECAICGLKETTNKLDVDHDHKTNKPRLLLCSSCNLMLGKAKDNVNILKAAIEYLKVYKF